MRARRDAGGLEVGRAQRRVEVAQRAACPTMHTGSRRRMSPSAIVSGTSADGRSTPTAVGSRWLRSRSPT